MVKKGKFTIAMNTMFVNIKTKYRPPLGGTPFWVHRTSFGGSLFWGNRNEA